MKTLQPKLNLEPERTLQENLRAALNLRDTELKRAKPVTAREVSYRLLRLLDKPGQIENLATHVPKLGTSAELGEYALLHPNRSLDAQRVIWRHVASTGLGSEISTSLAAAQLASAVSRASNTISQGAVLGLDDSFGGLDLQRGPDALVTKMRSSTAKSCGQVDSLIRALDNFLPVEARGITCRADFAAAGRSLNRLKYIRSGPRPA